jgi:hypothetical protein
MTADPLHVHRLPARRRFDRAALDDVLDAALVTHVALMRRGDPDARVSGGC